MHRGNDRGAKGAEHAGDLKVGDNDHHAQEEREGVEVDHLISLVGLERADDEHQRRSKQRDASAVNAQPGDATEGDTRIDERKDQDREKLSRKHSGGARRSP